MGYGGYRKFLTEPLLSGCANDRVRIYVNGWFSGAVLCFFSKQVDLFHVFAALSWLVVSRINLNTPKNFQKNIAILRQIRYNVIPQPHYPLKGAHCYGKYYTLSGGLQSIPFADNF